MSKSDQAFRTIREVADWLGVQTHVLRFWESKFPQIKPVKRAGGRRYYRPADMELIGGIKVLLHDQGMTIRGAQAMLREKGTEAICALSPPTDGMAISDAGLQGDAAEWAEDAAQDGLFEATRAEDDSQPGLPFDPPSASDAEPEGPDAPADGADLPAPVPEEAPAPAAIMVAEEPDKEPEPQPATAPEDAPTGSTPEPDDAAPERLPLPRLPQDGPPLDRLADFARAMADHPGALPDIARPCLDALAALKDRVAADPVA